MTVRGVIISTLFIVSLSPKILQGQFSPSAREMSIAYSDITSAALSPLSVNPALIPNTVSSVSSTAIPSPYGLPELSRYTADCNNPFSTFPLAVKLSTYGGKLYRQNEFSFGSGAIISKIISAGLSLSYKRFIIERYSSRSGLYFTGGFITKFSEDFAMGITLSDVPLESGRNNNTMNAALGITLKPVQDISLAAAYHQEELVNVYYSGGVEFAAAEYLTLRAGYVSNPAVYSFGFGLKYLKYLFDYAYLQHPQLGSVQQISIALGI